MFSFRGNFVRYDNLSLFVNKNKVFFLRGVHHDVHQHHPVAADKVGKSIGFLNLDALTSVFKFRHYILSFYWQILFFYQQRFLRKYRIREIMYERKYATGFRSRLFQRSKRLLQNPYFVSTLMAKERHAWLLYLSKFRLWYNLYRFLLSKKSNIVALVKPSTNFSRSFTDIQQSKLEVFAQCLLNKENLRIWSFKQDICDKLESKKLVYFESLHYNVRVSAKNYYFSPVSWKLKRYAVLFRKTRFRKRYHFFRLEKIFNYKRRGKPRYKSLFDYTHQRLQKIRVFYTTLGVAQFRKLFINYLFLQKKLISYLLVRLELRLEFFLYRINFCSSKYFAKQLLRHNGVSVNGKISASINACVVVGDRLGIVRSKFFLVYRSLYFRLRSFYLDNNFMASTVGSRIFPLIFAAPQYCELDYILLSAIICREPLLRDLFVPNYIEIDFENKNLFHLFNSYL